MPAHSDEILIVDDTPANLRLLAQMLTEQGYKVRAVLSGVRALAAVQLAPPDLILLDIKMPEMDGYEVCERLKQDPSTTDIPIIFISALGETHDKVRAFKVGGVDYVTKPFQVEEVLARVRTHLEMRQLQVTLQAANTELQMSLQEREDTNKQLRRLNADLTAFAETVAHDLKNPVGLMMGFAEVLSTEFKTMSSEELGQYLRQIARRGRTVVDIIDSLLLLAEASDKAVQLEPLDMPAIITECQSRLAPFIEQKQAQLVVPDVWPDALGYRPWVEAVWVNYISNALKYGGDPPHIVLGAEEADGNMVRFWIQDNGPGIPVEKQVVLFARFTRLDAKRARGHGLGLSIVHRIVEKMGGQVGVQSKAIPGEGSVFSFTLPAQ